jgi:hypothetical protein
LGTALTAGSHLSAAGEKKKRGGAVLGRRVARLGQLGRCARGKEKKRKGPAGLGWLRAKKRRKGERDGPAGEKKERGRGKRVFPFSFKFSFQIHFSNIQTSIKQNPCIRIMMHKHLLFLNHFSDV